MLDTQQTNLYLLTCNFVICNLLTFYFFFLFKRTFHKNKN